jgi:MFS family permease
MNTESAAAAINGNKAVYHCGTLTYTRAGLVVLFAWMLWGDFCYTLMEAVVPSILPLKLKSLGCSNWTMGLIMSTIPGVLGMTIGPYVSFKSDRHRSRWGRRIPFIIWTMPFLCVCLALLGWSDDICALLQKNSAFLSQFSPATVTIALIIIFMAMFQFFNDFVATVFCYLFNDVVPAQFLSRFMGLFRIAGISAAGIYNYFIFQYAESHMREIFLGTAVLYFVGFGLMCLMVKEGEYPPIEEEKQNSGKGMGGFKTFFKECFTHKFYWMIFAANAFFCISGSVACFDIFFRREMGLSLAQIGKLNAINGGALLLATYFAAIFIDRWHPVRIMSYVVVFNIIAVSMNWVWLFVSLPGIYYFWLCMGGNLIASFYSALQSVANTPRQMRLFPKSRYGQFCSGQAMLKWVCIIGSGVAAGLFVDMMKWLCRGSDFAYRFNFFWLSFFYAIGAVITIYSYIYWYRLGGDKSYQPPAPWSARKVEEMPVVPTIGPQSKWLNIAFRLFDTIMIISTLGIPVLMWWMYYKQTLFAFKWFGILLLPLSLLAWIYWKFVERGIRRDMERARKCEPLLRGIPHHGMMMIVGIKFLLALSLWIAQIIITISMNMEFGAIIFGVANIITNFMLIGLIQLMSYVEKGFSMTIDENQRACLTS